MKYKILNAIFLLTIILLLVVKLAPLDQSLRTWLLLVNVVTCGLWARYAVNDNKSPDNTLFENLSPATIPFIIMLSSFSLMLMAFNE